MRIALKERERTETIVLLAALLPPSLQPVALKYETNTGALARVDGKVAGAFDREHRRLLLQPAAHERELTLEVERRSLPTNGLPPGPGLRWQRLLRSASERPSSTLYVTPLDSRAAAGEPAAPGDLPLWGHSHLDVAWLWTYDATRRKATRTFANALALLDDDPAFVFMQSQPQLYEYVREADGELFARVAEEVRKGRFDPDIAALWVEPDCNVPSGESLLRQMLFAHRFCTERFGVEPSIAWLPDTFGFARTLPTLLAHAGIAYFGTTKLAWNDTTPFAHRQFRWRGPDGAEVVAASMAGMDGDCSAPRVNVARERGEPLIVGYGDGGGGPTGEQLAAARATGRWERPRAWFERLAARRDALPVHDDELYLEYHRGVYTTHRDVKANNAALERQLDRAEEQAAWGVALRLPPDALARVRESLRAAWEIVLRNQFHDVLPGTSISDVYADAAAEYARAGELVGSASAAVQAMLPRAARGAAAAPLRAPREADGAYEFENDRLRARVLPTGALVELEAPGGTNMAAQANLLAYYRDRPKKWEAWNIDAGYERSRKHGRPHRPQVADGALEIPFDLGRSRATMRVSLGDGDGFLRVDLAVDWRSHRELLRVENWLATHAEEATFGAPHGTVVRSARRDTPERRARFEVPGQRFAFVRGERGDAFALLALDTYGWDAQALQRGGLRLGHSLLRATGWPDPDADRGEHHLSWAYAPLAGARISDVERLWLDFAREPRVRLFESADESVTVVACKPADDGDGVIVRIRECDGTARAAVALRCGGRMRDVHAVDGLERPCDGDARIERESIVASIGAFALRSFRVRF